MYCQDEKSLKKTILNKQKHFSLEKDLALLLRLQEGLFVRCFALENIFLRLRQTTQIILHLNDGCVRPT